MVCSLLLEAGADTWCRDHPYRRTCLHYAAEHGHALVIDPVVLHSRTSSRSRQGSRQSSMSRTCHVPIQMMR